MPSGLSMTSQPCSPGSAGPGSSGPESAGAVIVLSIGMEIALDLRLCEQGRDPRRAIECVVERKGEVRHMAQLNEARQPALQKGRAAPESRDDLFGIGAAERHDKRGRVAQIGAEANLSDRDIGVMQGGVAQFARPQQFGEPVAQLLPDTQLPLTGRAHAAEMILSFVLFARHAWAALEQCRTG